MKHFHWMAALMAATLVLAACGSMQDAGLQPELGVSAVAGTVVSEIDDAAPFVEMPTASYGLGATCWVAGDVPSAADLSMDEPTPAGSFASTDLDSARFDALTGLNQRTLDRLGRPTDPTLQQVLDHPQAYGGAAFNDVGDKLSPAHPDVDFLRERVEDSCPLSADASRRS